MSKEEHNDQDAVIPNKSNRSNNGSRHPSRTNSAINFAAEEVMRQLKAEGIQIDPESELQLIAKITDELLNDFNRESDIGLTLGSIARLKLYARKARKGIAEKRTKKHWLIIWPDNKQKLAWDLVNFGLLIYSVFEIPFALSFLPSSCNASPLENFNLFVDCFFMCDVCLQFISAYVDTETGVLISEPRQIIFNYIKGWLLFDIVSSLPLDRIVCSVASSSSGFVRSVKIIRCLKVIRFLRMVRIVQKLEEDVGTFASNSTRLLKLIGILLLCTHVCSCIWYGMIDSADCHILATRSPAGTSAVCGCEGDGCNDWNWLARYDPDIYQSDPIDPRSRYLVSLYFAIVTLTTLGYGDVLPTNDSERLFVVALVIAGALMFSFLISSISSIVSQGNTVENAVSRHTSELSDLCTFRNLPKSIRVRARAHLSYTLNRAPYLLNEFALLPRAMRNELTEALTRDTIGAVASLAGLEADSRTRLAPMLRPCSFPPRQEIFRALDTATEMYWILTGEVEVQDVGGKTVGRARPGDLVGACEMFPEGGAPVRPWTARVRGRARCEMLELSKADLFGGVQELLPDVFGAVRAYVKEHVRGLDLAEVRQRLAERSRLRCRDLEERAQRSKAYHKTVEEVCRRRGLQLQVRVGKVRKVSAAAAAFISAMRHGGADNPPTRAGLSQVVPGIEGGGNSEVDGSGARLDAFSAEVAPDNQGEEADSQGGSDRADDVDEVVPWSDSNPTYLEANIKAGGADEQDVTVPAANFVMDGQVFKRRLEPSPGGPWIQQQPINATKGLSLTRQKQRQSAVWQGKGRFKYGRKADSEAGVGTLGKRIDALLYAHKKIAEDAAAVQAAAVKAQDELKAILDLVNCGERFDGGDGWESRPQSA